jgi:hypothetical protein
MNARQKAKKYKQKINVLKSDNDLMRRIIADTPAMQELYDAYNKPKFVTHTTMQFQEFRAMRVIPPYMVDVKGVIEHTKQAVAEDLFEEIKENITYEVDTEDKRSIITASIFVGKR